MPVVQESVLGPAAPESQTERRGEKLTQKSSQCLRSRALSGILRQSHVKAECSRCNHDRAATYECCGSEVLTLKCAKCGHVFPVTLTRASPWRGDKEFCKLAKETWPEDYRLATGGGYDKGAVQKLLHRWQGLRALVNSGVLGMYLDVYIIAMRPYQWDDNTWKLWQNRFEEHIRSA